MSPIEIGGPNAQRYIVGTSFSTTDATVAGGDLDAGSPMGLLLALTYPETLAGGGSSINTHLINDSLGRNSRLGWLINDGDGDLNLRYSYNGSTFSDYYPVHSGEHFTFEDISIHTIQIGYMASTTATYRIFLV